MGRRLDGPETVSDCGIEEGRRRTISRSHCLVPIVWGLFLWGLPPFGAAHADDAGDPAHQREFPKTLTFDEPGVDDEMSLPTLSRLPQAATADSPAGAQSGISFELDKRITERLSLQIASGYSLISRQNASSLAGWQTLEATLKGVVLDDGPAERLVSLSLSRDFGGTGAERVGGGGPSATIAAVNAAQGFGAAPVWAPLRPFAVTGSIGYLAPDRSGSPGGDPQLLLLDASLQYSMAVLFAGMGDVPDVLHRLIPLTEITYALPTTAPSGSQARRGTLSPGLIYTGDGYQLAAEALIPLTRATGTHVGAVAQLNLSLGWLGWAALTRPLF